MSDMFWLMRAFKKKKLMFQMIAKMFVAIVVLSQGIVITGKIL